MGLDISVYRNVEPTERHAHTDACYDRGHVYVYEEWPFRQRMDPLVPGRCYKADEVSDLAFRAGSYSGYSVWRDTLAQRILGVPATTVWNEEAKFEGKPFNELINFSDCEGVIGSTISAKLHADFVTFRDKFFEPYDIGGVSIYDGDRYDDWRRAFEVAKDGGMVVFH